MNAPRLKSPDGSFLEEYFSNLLAGGGRRLVSLAFNFPKDGSNTQSKTQL